MKKLVPSTAILVPDGAQLVFKGVLFDVYHWPQEMFDGSTATFEMLKRQDSTNVICVIDGKILVMNDLQPHHNVHRKFPGGRVEATDEDITSAAQREILEEIGYTFSSWKLLYVKQYHEKFEWFAYLLIASDVVDTVEVNLDPGEKNSTELLSFDAVKALVMDRVGYLDIAAGVFAAATNLEALLALPEAEGQEVDR